MLPIWLDEDISDLGAWMLSRVRQVSADDDLPETFIQALYRRKRLLLVADRLSEKQAKTQKAIRHPPGYLNALVVTSRTEQDFGLPDVKIIEAVPLGSENLMGFVNDLLESRIDGDDAFHGFKSQVDLARRLADVITIGQQELPVTPLLVKLFVERALEQAKRSGKPDLDALPQSVPDVYFDYLRSVNPDDPSAANYLPNDVMMEAAKLVARVELGDDFRPKRIAMTQLQAALQQAGLGGGSNPLQRLLDNQVLEKKNIGASTLVAFALDPIAEYVAAFAHAQDCGRDQKRWSDLRAKVAERGDDAAGFSEALRVTHEVFSQDFGWP
jgi:hypothetical protein